MSTHFPNWNLGDVSDLHVAIITARFNGEITSALLEGARQCLRERNVDWDEYTVPGAFELPFAAQKIADEFDAVVALGAVIRGDTPHFDFVANECARGLMDVGLRSEIPVAFGVLTVDTMEQARERAGGKHGNKGYDAAMTALEMAGFGD